MTQDRPRIKDDIKREVRQRCGFGCVICGRPIYEYDHMLGWANVKRHEASEITLLCDNHHREKTSGFLPNERVLEANGKPFNVQHGVTAPHTLHYSGMEFTLKVGGFEISGTSSCEAIRVDGESLIGVRLEDGHFLLSMTIYDVGGDIVLLIDDNELVLNTHMWDIEVEGSRVTIREGKGIILFDIVFRPPSTVVIMRGRFLRNGVELLVAPKWSALLNTRRLFSDIGLKHLSVGLDLGDAQEPINGPGGIHIGGIPRTDWDRTSAVRWARGAAANLPNAAAAVDELLSSESLD
jgi:hypothetical protein